MKNLLHAGQYLAEDLASTLLFLVVYLLIDNITVAVTLGMALGLGQIVWQRAHRRAIDAMQWMSLLLVLASGGATLLTDDPRFVMVKPSLIYLAIGIVMLKRGWMIRYLPPEAVKWVPDVAVIFGYVWAGLMFASAMLNLILALILSAADWAEIMSVYGIASKITLFALAFLTMRFIGRRRYRAQLAGASL